MSQLPPPPPFDPLFYASPHVPQKSPRPTSVTVIAILAIIWGSLHVLAMLCTIPQYLGVNLAPNPAMDGIRKDPVLLSVSIFNMAIGLLLGVLVLACGIGALSLKPWSRIWMIRYAVIYFFFAIVSTVFNLLFIQPRMEQAMQTAMPANSPFNAAQFQSMMHIGRYVGVCFAVLFLLWPVAILYYMTRPHVKAAFQGGAPSVGYLTPMQPPPSMG